MIPPEDLQFLKKKIMKRFHIEKLRIREQQTRYKWPDCWVETNGIPVITVTQEWARQPVDERRKRLVHEAAHILGLQHGIVDGLHYSTYPEQDEWSWKEYSRLVDRRNR